jgi:predicted SprT family Zn-dependent metalloprotease
MHTLKDVEILATQLLAKAYSFKANGKSYLISPTFDLDYTFKFDNAKRRLGCCKYGRREITLSRALTMNNLDKVHGKLTDTILHEIAHALSVYVHGTKLGRGHGANWVSIATQIGCNGNRCYTNSEIDAVQSKYTLICPTCNREASRHRLPKNGIACGVCCNGRYDARHKFIIQKNY